jgi:hypothetical protein
MDVCDGSDWGVDQPIDFVYLAGVLHHFHGPGAAVTQMRRVLKPGGRCFFRIYRSGSLAFYVVEALRKIIRYDDRDLVTEMFFRLHPESHWQVYMGLYDDFFVPVLGLYDPKSIDAYMQRAGFRVTKTQLSVPYDHGDTQVSGQGVSLYYEWSGENAAFDEQFPPHVDQLTDIAYREPHIRTTTALLQDLIDSSPHLDRRVVIDAALRLHEAGQLYRLHRATSSLETHGKLQSILKPLVAKRRPATLQSSRSRLARRTGRTRSTTKGG